MKRALTAIGGITLAAIMALGLALLPAQEPEDPHAGQPKTCDNSHKNAHKCECHRATKCKEDRPDHEDSKCATYCRKEACRCIDPCAS
jgi:hypothetical protein